MGVPACKDRRRGWQSIDVRSWNERLGGGRRLVHRGEQFLQSVGYPFGFEPEGPGAGLVGDAAVAIDYVEAVGPAGVVAFGGVLEIIEHGRKFDAELDDAHLPHLGALVHIFRRSENHVIVDVVGILPYVGGVRFAYINRVERDLILVFFIQRV